MVIPGFLCSLGPTSQPAGKHLDSGALQGGPNRGRAQCTHSGDKAVIAVLLSVEDPVFDEDGDGPQHKRHEEVHVDEVAGAVQLPTPTAGEDRCPEVRSPTAFHPPPWGPLWADSTALSQGGQPPRPPLLPSSLNPHSFPGSHHLAPLLGSILLPAVTSLHLDQEDNARGVGLLPMVCLAVCGPGQVSCPLWGPISYCRSLSRDLQG